MFLKKENIKYINNIHNILADLIKVINIFKSKSINKTEANKSDYHYQ